MLLASVLFASGLPSCLSSTSNVKNTVAEQEAASTIDKSSSDVAANYRKSYTSETLEVHKIADQVYQHLSFLETQSFGKVPCNGMVVIDQQEAIIFDTPTTDQASLELIDWVEQRLGCKVKAVVATHFHQDCLGGLPAFQRRGIPTYASHKTIALAKANRTAVPENGFHKELTFEVGNEKVLVLYPGKGHTHDNVVGYFPKAEAMFGGCLIKEVGAGKGNLADADTVAWPLTVANLKTAYPRVKHVIPGHGKVGGPELLDYTVRLFEPK
ncbi:subclass B1 metallo-beta-lactamase [Pontibacter sp. BT731]|uniref:subclass B1 metallo-beta-lactamase n=1 Tax=Pontibacter coccineus TaxID=3063328 RepID=UPI0026E19A96|nr:subclass B1 metallo-beta-lactamase [Pontibacter sp. BT731]MDO6388946.1 subclass B1 metallo-beta-lactamase [Pontibacter sp. BT731]